MDDILLDFDEEAEQKKQHNKHFREKKCVFCDEKIDSGFGEMTAVGTMHRKCVLPWKRQQRIEVERCSYCDGELGEKRLLKGKSKIHPECQAGFKSKMPYVKPTKCGMVEKFSMGRSTFGKKNWKTRFLVISPEVEGGGLAYYENQAAWESKKAPKNSLKIGELVRMIARPNALGHSSCTSANNEIVVIFPNPDVTTIDSKQKDHRLLLRFTGLAEKEEYLEVLKKYVRIIDYPDDYLHREGVFVK